MPSDPRPTPPKTFATPGSTCDLVVRQGLKSCCRIEYGDTTGREQWCDYCRSHTAPDVPPPAASNAVKIDTDCPTCGKPVIGLHLCTGGRPRRCVERDRQPARWARGTVVLTTAHLRAMCNRCHLRVDVELPVTRAAGSRDARRGQSRCVPLAYEEAEARRRANAARLEIDRWCGPIGAVAD